MIAKISRPLAVLALIGWALTLLMSLASLVGFGIPAGARNVFFLALCPLMLGAILMLNWRVDGRILTPLFIWNDAIESAPAWLRYAAFGTMSFAFGLFGVQFFNVFVPGASMTMAVLSQLYAFTAVALLVTSRPAPKSSSLRAN